MSPRKSAAAAAELTSSNWSGRPVKNRRAQIRAELGLRGPAVGDEDKLADWLATGVCPYSRGLTGVSSATGRTNAMAQTVPIPAGQPLEATRKAAGQVVMLAGR